MHPESLSSKHTVQYRVRRLELIPTGISARPQGGDQSNGLSTSPSVSYRTCSVLYWTCTVQYRLYGEHTVPPYSRYGTYLHTVQYGTPGSEETVSILSVARAREVPNRGRGTEVLRPVRVRVLVPFRGLAFSPGTMPYP